MSQFKESLPSLPLPVWKDMGPLYKAIRSRIHDTLYDEYFVGPRGESEQVPFVARRRHIQVTDNLRGPEQPFLYVRIGNLSFLDHQLQDALPSDVKQDYKENIIWLWNFQSDIRDATHVFYASLALYPLTTLDLKGKNVLDIGAADGVQSLGAQ